HVTKEVTMQILYHIPSLPTKIVDPVEHDCGRIRYALARYHLDCTYADAAIIREAIRPLPFDDDELLERASEYAFVNWGLAQDKLEPVLRELYQRYQSSVATHSTRWTERQIIAVTRGLSEHPEWWNIICHCDSCVEDGQ